MKQINVLNVREDLDFVFSLEELLDTTTRLLLYIYVGGWGVCVSMSADKCQFPKAFDGHLPVA